MNYCKTCNASQNNTVERVIRCGVCVVQPMKAPNKWKASRTRHPQDSIRLAPDVRGTENGAAQSRGQDPGRRADVIRNTFAAIGIVVVTLWLCGSLGIGHFALIYGGSPINCGSHGSTKK